MPFSVADGFGLAVWSVLGTSLLTLLAGLVYVLATGDTTPDVEAGIVLVVLAQTAATFGVFVYLRWRGRLSWRLLGPLRPAWWHLPAGVGVGVLGFVVVQVGVGFLARRAGEVDAPDQSLLAVFRDGGLAAILVVVAAVVIAPVLEETVFRGVLFQGLRRRIGLWPGAVISGLVFGVVHHEVVTLEALPSVAVAVASFGVALLPRVALGARAALAGLGFASLAWTAVVIGVGPVLYPLGLAALGVLLAWALHRTGSLLVPIVGHATFNGVALLLVALAEGLEPTV